MIQRQISCRIAIKNERGSEAKSSSPNEIADNYLREIIVSCFREFEVKPNFESQILFQYSKEVLS